MQKIIDFIKGTKMTFVEKIQETENIWSFTFKPEKNLNWQAGQHMLITAPHPNADKKGNKRMYSVSSAPYEETVQITTRASENGTSYKQALLSLQPGDQVVGRGPVGPMSVKDPSQKFIFIAGGIGITPFRSILRQLAEEQKSPDITLLYGTSKESVLFQSELETYRQAHGNFKLKYIFSPKRVSDRQIREVCTDLVNTTFFVSGPQPMVAEIKKILKSLGVKKITSDPFYGYN